MTPASSLAKSASVVLAVNCPSIESRVCSTTSSSASASTMGGMSGCHRLCPVWACCASGLLRSISTIFTVPPNGRVSHNVVTSLVLCKHSFDLFRILRFRERQHQEDAGLLRVECVCRNHSHPVVLFATHDSTVAGSARPY